MIIYNEIASLRASLEGNKKQGRRIALVPTMGNLHAGHLSLVEKASLSADCVVVSIFVNPLQFGENEDFSTYPRTLEADLEKLSGLGVDFIFAPKASLMYPSTNKQSTRVSVLGLSDELCGVTRPHFFYGVATVLAKLFHIVQPDVVIFGEKDYQQLIVVRRMVEDLNFPISVLGMPIMREADGLAMSSRNQYLNKNERALAKQLYLHLSKLKENILSDIKNFPEVIADAIQKLNSVGFKTDYISLRKADDLSEIKKTDLPELNAELIVLAAAYLGKTRLLDNIKFIL